MKTIALGTAALAALSLSACGSGAYPKSQPRPGYDLVFASDAITSGPVECAMLDAQLASAVPGCRDYAPIVDRQTFDTAKFEDQEIWSTRAPVSCGWLRPDSATVSAVPACYVWVKRDAAGLRDGTAAAPTPAPSSGQSSSNGAGNTSVAASSTSGPEGDTDSASSSTDGVSTSASTTSQADGTGGFSVDNGHTSMSGTFGADGSVSSVSFGGSGAGATSQ